ncbi:MAG: rhomboid family intramembrane serine protease [Candidatus Bathyarchaeia archaeon]
MAAIFPIQDENRPSRKPFVNWGLVAINVIVFFFLFFQPYSQYDYFYKYGAIPYDILQGRNLWTLITHMFFHADMWHIIGNMIFLWVFGDNVEDTFGHAKYLLFYLSGGIFAEFTHIASVLISQQLNMGQNLFIPTIGASGAIAAVLGAYVLLFPHARIKTVVYVIYIITFTSVPAFYYLGFWFIYQVLMGLGTFIGTSSSVAFWAHIGGFVFGLVAIKVVGVEKMRKRHILRIEQPMPMISAPVVITPLVDVIVDDDRVTILANMPGLDSRNIKIEVSESLVVISAEYVDLKFYKQIILPVRVIPKVENALYHNGVLSFSLPRM